MMTTIVGAASAPNSPGGAPPVATSATAVMPYLGAASSSAYATYPLQQSFEARLMESELEAEICQRFVRLSCEKMLASRNSRSGARLHRNLLILHLLRKARNSTKMLPYECASLLKRQQCGTTATTTSKSTNNNLNNQRVPPSSSALQCRAPTTVVVYQPPPLHHRYNEHSSAKKMEDDSYSIASSNVSSTSSSSSGYGSIADDDDYVGDDAVEEDDVARVPMMMTMMMVEEEEEEKHNDKDASEDHAMESDDDVIAAVNDAINKQGIVNNKKDDVISSDDVLKSINDNSTTSSTSGIPSAVENNKTTTITTITGPIATNINGDFMATPKSLNQETHGGERGNETTEVSNGHRRQTTVREDTDSRTAFRYEYHHQSGHFSSSSSIAEVEERRRSESLAVRCASSTTRLYEKRAAMQSTASSYFTTAFDGTASSAPAASVSPLCDAVLHALMANPVSPPLDGLAAMRRGQRVVAEDDDWRYRTTSATSTSLRRSSTLFDFDEEDFFGYGSGVASKAEATRSELCYCDEDEKVHHFESVKDKVDMVLDYDQFEEDEEEDEEGEGEETRSRKRKTSGNATIGEKRHCCAETTVASPEPRSGHYCGKCGGRQQQQQMSEKPQQTMDFDGLYRRNVEEAYSRSEYGSHSYTSLTTFDSYSERYSCSGGSVHRQSGSDATLYQQHQYRSHDQIVPSTSTASATSTTAVAAVAAARRGRQHFVGPIVGFVAETPRILMF